MGQRRESKAREGFGSMIERVAKEHGISLEQTPGEMVRANRVSRFDMTLRDLAEITGVKESNLSNIENGKVTMTPHYAEIFGAAFGLSAISFLYPNGREIETTNLAEVKNRMQKFIAGRERQAKSSKSAPPKRISRSGQVGVAKVGRLHRSRRPKAG